MQIQVTNIIHCSKYFVPVSKFRPVLIFLEISVHLASELRIDGQSPDYKMLKKCFAWVLEQR